MRQVQHNKRSRGRGRKSSSPGNRVYESNGPDVKVRGNASHVAEKYVNLARDASLSGDLVAAENYLQHAEHYFRLVAAAQTQIRQDQVQNRTRQGGDQPNSRPQIEGADPVDDSDDSDGGQDGSASEAASEGAAEQVRDGRSAGRNRRPSASRRPAKSGNGEDSGADATNEQIANGGDTEEDRAEVQVEVEKMPQSSDLSSEESATSEDIAEAEL